MPFNSDSDSPEEAVLDPWFCSCGGKNSAGADYCAKCGAPRNPSLPDELEIDEREVVARGQAALTPPERLRRCPECGTRSAARVCPKCGFQFHAPRGFRRETIYRDAVHLPRNRWKTPAMVAFWIFLILAAIAVAKFSFHFL